MNKILLNIGREAYYIIETDATPEEADRLVKQWLDEQTESYEFEDFLEDQGYQARNIGPDHIIDIEV